MVTDYVNITSMIRNEGELIWIGALIVPKNQEEQNEEAKQNDKIRTDIPYQTY